MFITNALFQWFYLFSQWDMNFRYSLKWMATVGTKVSIIIYHKTGFSLMAFNLQNLSTLPTDFLMNTFKSHLIMTKYYKAFCRTWCFPCRMFEVIQNILKWVSNHLTMDTNCITVYRRTCAQNGYMKLMAKCHDFILQIIILEPIFVLFCWLKLFDSLHSMLFSKYSF